MDDKISKNNSSFWQLINGCKIIIPQLQRDYAQGRDDEIIKQIRESLIAEFYDALYSRKPLVLNFIYGERTDEMFIPIDGQQRLTSLFLLHWYVFSRAGYQDGREKLKDFSYLTRDSSRRFCDRLCGLNIDFSQVSLRRQIEDCFWFSGNFKTDPTVQSMVVVLDEIHSKFSEIYDFVSLKDELIGADCPITFLWQPMDNFQKTDDLYIKMNARGKLLSDFEIFKAKLQNSSILITVLGANATEKEKIVFISKYNNQYADLFYRFQQQKYDEVLMSFIVSLVRDEYYSYASFMSVPQKDYRDKYKQILGMNGSVFYRFIEAGGDNFERFTNGHQIIAQAIKRIDGLLDIFCNEDELDIPVTYAKKYYSERDLFVTNFVPSKQTFEANVVVAALYEYFYKFGYPKTNDQLESYNMWKRFIYNMVNNTKFAGLSEYICEAMALFKDMLSKLSGENKSNMLSLIASYNDRTTAELKYQQKEEQIKASLMNSSEKWEKIILLAEEYFSDGQIGFLLEFCKKDDENYDITLFEKYFELSKCVFSGKKDVNENCNKNLLEQALLCMEDDSTSKTAHLAKQTNSTTSWGFYRNNYSKLLSNRDGGSQRNMVRLLFESLATSADIDGELKKIIDEVDVNRFLGIESWKLPFIQNNLFDILLGRFRFANCIHLAKSNQEVLLLSGTTVRSYSMELNTLLLAAKMRAEGIGEPKMSLHMEKTGDIVDTDGFPLRYIEYKGVKTGYLNNKMDKPFVSKQRDGTLSSRSFDEAYDYLSKL